ncbi:hypothetical protein O0880_10570 [Janthinobacterium sp. SUN118]|uniref:hypothetical protein n=1 Tax=Janthinobacterium sp. SUN118 TaxID=3004100 RepID=UPI0025B1296B|nr:hypothetical protein [Janthinobacterium sp. SUN118]MDN2709857.1 hypothetical protein [Janthinobacterium sp. SUN118]
MMCVLPAPVALMKQCAGRRRCSLVWHAGPEAETIDALLRPEISRPAIGILHSGFFFGHTDIFLIRNIMGEREKQKIILDKFCYELIETIDSCNLEQLDPIHTQLNFLSNNHLMMHDFIGAFLTLSQAIAGQRDKLKAS